MEISPAIVGLIGFIILFVFMFLGMPVAYTFLVVGFAGLWYLRSSNAALVALPETLWGMSTDYVLICIPLFIFMGNLANGSGIGPDLYKTALKWFGRLPGGLGLTTIAGNAAFGAVTGASLAGLVTFTPIAWKPMLELGYDKRLGAGCLICSGTLSQLIPPSLTFIIYSAITQESIGQLFIAGIIPGILQAIMYIILVIMLVKLKIWAGPPGPASTWKEKLISLKGVWGMAFTFILVIGGMYAGLFTSTEGAAVGVAGVLLIFLARQGFNYKLLFENFSDSLRTTAMITLILFTSLVFARFIALSGVTNWVGSLVVGSSLNPFIVLAGVCFVLLIAGCVMPAIPMMLLFVPMFYPIIVGQFHMDGIWFGVIITIMVEFALVTPPVGIHLFAFSSLVKDITMWEIWQSVLPFVIMDTVRLVIMIAFPIITLWLPQHMFAT